MGLNWPAILVAGIADWILGAVWFTVLANQWKAGLRMTPDEMQTYMAHPNFWPYIIALVCSIILAYVIARLLGSASTRPAGEAELVAQWAYGMFLLWDRVTAQRQQAADREALLALVSG